MNALEAMGSKADRTQWSGNTYYMLGRVAEERHGPGEAEQWYRKALAIAEEFDDRTFMALTYGVLALVAKERGQLPGHWLDG